MTECTCILPISLEFYWYIETDETDVKNEFDRLCYENVNKIAEEYGSYVSHIRDDNHEDDPTIFDDKEYLTQQMTLYDYTEIEYEDGTWSDKIDDIMKEVCSLYTADCRFKYHYRVAETYENLIDSEESCSSESCINKR